MIKILGVVGCSKATECLIPGVLDKDNYIASASCIALGQIGDPEAVPSLIERVGRGDCGWGESSAHAAAMALVRIGEPSIRPLVKVLSKKKRIKTRIGAAYTLGHMKTTEAIPALVKVLESHDVTSKGFLAPYHLANAACVALGRIGDPAAIPALEAFQTLDHKHLREAAEEALEGLRKIATT